MADSYEVSSVTRVIDTACISYQLIELRVIRSSNSLRNCPLLTQLLQFQSFRIPPTQKLSFAITTRTYAFCFVSTQIHVQIFRVYFSLFGTEILFLNEKASPLFSSH